MKIKFDVDDNGKKIEIDAGQIMSYAPLTDGTIIELPSKKQILVRNRMSEKTRVLDQTGKLVGALHSVHDIIEPWFLRRGFEFYG